VTALDGLDGWPVVDPWLVVTVDGPPRPQGSKRALGRGVLVESSQGLPAWRARVAAAAAAAADDADWVPLAVPTMVALRFAMPPGVARGRRLARGVQGPVPSPSSPDLDKLVRAVFDGLGDSGRVWVDDRVVAAVAAVRVWAGTEADPTPGVAVVVAALAEA
jgi:crossover junction endodeoxyribonuclease RusA